MLILAVLEFFGFQKKLKAGKIPMICLFEFLNWPEGFAAQNSSEPFFRRFLDVSFAFLLNHIRVGFHTCPAFRVLKSLRC